MNSSTTKSFPNHFRNLPPEIQRLAQHKVPSQTRFLAVRIAPPRAVGVNCGLVDTVDNHVLAPTPPPARPAFWSEFQEYWARVPEKGLFLALVAGWCALFQLVGTSSFNFTKTPSLFAWMYNAWNEPVMDCGHGILIPFVVAILLWVKRRELAASIATIWWPGLALVGLALLIHVLGFLAQQPRVSMMALFLGLYGLIGLVWGWRTMWVSSFPMVLFFFCLPLGLAAQVVTLPLRLVSVTLTRMVCHGLLDINVVQSGTKLLDPAGKYEFDVVAACSGMRGLVASLLVASVFAMLSLRSVWRQALMLLSTIPLAICGNLLRLTVVVLVGQAYGQSAAMWVHELVWVFDLPDREHRVIAAGGALAEGQTFSQERMNKSKWLVLAAALAMMAVTGDYLAKVRERTHWGAPGVKVGPGPLLTILWVAWWRSKACFCPRRFWGCKGADLPVTQAELEALPKDTTFGRKLYRMDNLSVVISVVLMGSDRTSIHDPHYCLEAADWHIEKTERVVLPMDRPYPYNLQALKLTSSRTGFQE